MGYDVREWSTSVLLHMAAQARHGLRIEEARAYYNEAAARLSGDTLTLQERARILRDLARFLRPQSPEDALHRIDQFIQLGESQDRSLLFFSDYVYRAAALVAVGNLETAQIAFGDAIRIVDERAIPYRDLRLFHIVAEDCQFVAADCTPMIAAMPDFAPPYFCRALAYRELGEPAQAFSDLERAESLDRAHHAIWRAQRRVIEDEHANALAEAEKGNILYRAYFAENVEYCLVDWEGDGNRVVSVGVYDRQIGRSEPVPGDDLSVVQGYLTGQGWELFRTQGHHEGMTYYYRRQKEAKLK